MNELRPISLPALAAMLRHYRSLSPPPRRIDALHLHASFRPSRSQFRGQATLEAIRRHHVEACGLVDLAQHLSIDPDGGLWLGRPWTLPPASVVGSNGNATAGPLMIELIGDFDDRGRDRFDSSLQAPQERMLIDVLALLLEGLDLHNRALQPSCRLKRRGENPGRQLVNLRTRDLKPDIVAAIVAGRARMAALLQRQPDRLSQADRLRGWLETGGRALALERDAEAPRSDQVVEAFAPAGGTRSTTDRRWQALVPHVVNLTAGRLSESGGFRMEPGSIEAILDGAERFLARRDPGHRNLLLWAHGGLVDETSGLSHASEFRDRWLEQGIYPVFFVWESSNWLITLLQALTGRRRDLTDPIDMATQTLLGPVFRGTWTTIKSHAERAFASDAGGRIRGGGRIFLDALQQRPGLAGAAIHLVGHSAGAIFQAHLIQDWIGRLGRKVASVHLLAPAIRNEAFRRLMTDGGNRLRPGIGRLSLYTMDEARERADDLQFPVYFKSLLYFISRALEDRPEAPILGLQESLRADPMLDDRRPGALFVDAAALRFAQPGEESLPGPWLNSPGLAKVHWADGRNPATQAARHGDFDNDPATLQSIANDILGTPDCHRGLCGGEIADRGVGDELSRWFGLLAELSGGGPRPAVVAAMPTVTGKAPGGPGQRRALIVGIDAYPRQPLEACGNDARAIAGLLRQHGFAVTELPERAATRAGLTGALTGLLSGSAAGDELVFFFAGHGVQLPDFDGDEQQYGRAYDQAYAPIDFDRAGFLVDDEFAALLDAHLAAGAWLTTVTDCCHSGTIHRMLLDAGSDPGVRVRGLTPSLAEVEQARAEALASRGAGHPPRPERAGHLHLAACLDHQTAKERDGHGVFTAALLADAGALFAGEPVARWLDRLRQAVALKAHDQTPHLDGDPGRRLQPLLRAPR